MPFKRAVAMSAVGPPPGNTGPLEEAVDGAAPSDCSVELSVNGAAVVPGRAGPVRDIVPMEGMNATPCVLGSVFPRLLL